jgi:flagellar protein FlaJ
MRLYEFVFQLMPKNYKKWVDSQLKCANFTVPPQNYSGFSIIYGITLGMVVLLVVYLIGLTATQMAFTIGIFTAIVFEVVMHVIPVMVSDSRAKFTDEILPDALRLISSNVRSGLTPDKALLLSARPEFGPLEDEIRSSAKLTLSGEPIEDSIQTISKNINSKALKRSVDLLAEGMARGGDLASLLDGLADEIRQTSILRKEVRAFVMMYAMFIFFAAGIGAPLLYGISSFLVETMGEMGSRIDVKQTFPTGMKFMTFQGIAIEPQFLIVYVSISLGVTAFFGGLLIGLIQEGTERAGLRYIPILLMMSLSVFFLTRIMIERVFGAMA